MSKIIVNITREVSPSVRTAFGTALLILNTAHTFKEYANLTAVGEDFATTTTAYKFAQAYFGQENAPSKLAIAGVLYDEDTDVVNETLTLVSGNQYSFANGNIKVDSIANLEDNSVPIPSSDITEIDYVNGTITFATPKTTVTADYTHFNTASAITTLLDQLVLDGEQFYGIMLEASGWLAQKEIDTWVEDKRYLPAFRTDVLPAEFPVTLPNSIQPYYHLTADEYPEAAVFGKCLPLDPGSLTWNLQTLSGVTAQALTNAVETAITTGRFNSVTVQYGETATLNGFFGLDLYIDQKRSQDYVEVTMMENIGALLIRENKIPYDDRGITQIVAEVEKTLNQAYNIGIIAAKGDLKTPDFVVNSQSRAEIVENDPTAITQRILRSITFQYVEAGAIESATINGEIVLQL